MKFTELARKALRTINAAPRAGEVSPEDLNIAFEAANDMLDAWAAKRLTIFQVQRKVYPGVTGKGSPSNPYTIGPGGDFDQPRPLWIPNAECQVNTTTPPFEFPLNILKDDDWARTSIKALASSLPSDLYYDYRFPVTGIDTGLGQIYLYPVPNGGQPISIVLYTPLALARFADRDITDYTFPPGYAEALRYQLAIRLAIELGYEQPQDLKDMAATTFGVIQRPNARIPVLRSDQGMAGMAGGGFYNWRLGTMTRRG